MQWVKRDFKHHKHVTTVQCGSINLTLLIKNSFLTNGTIIMNLFENTNYDILGGCGEKWHQNWCSNTETSHFSTNSWNKNNTNVKSLWGYYHRLDTLRRYRAPTFWLSILLCSLLSSMIPQYNIIFQQDSTDFSCVQNGFRLFVREGLPFQYYINFDDTLIYSNKIHIFPSEKCNSLTILCNSTVGKGLHVHSRNMFPLFDFSQ